MYFVRNKIYFIEFYVRLLCLSFAFWNRIYVHGLLFLILFWHSWIDQMKVYSCHLHSPCIDYISTILMIDLDEFIFIRVPIFLIQTRVKHMKNYLKTTSKLLQHCFKTASKELQKNFKRASKLLSLQCITTNSKKN